LPGPPRPLLALLLASFFTLGLGFALKDSCNGPSWDGYQYRALCYNDIVPLYYAHGFDSDVFPYVDHPERDAQQPKEGYDPAKPDTHWGFVEYPVLTGMHLWFAAKMGTAWVRAFGGHEDGQMFLYMNAVLLSGFALATVVLLWRMTGDPRRVAYFAAGTPIVLYAFHNWDLMAVFFLVLTIYLFERQRFYASGVALSLGASAKLFPIVAAPFLFFVLWRRVHDPNRAGNRPPAWAARAAIAGSALGLLAAILAIAAVSSVPLFFASVHLVVLLLATLTLLSSAGAAASAWLSKRGQGNLAPAVAVVTGLLLLVLAGPLPALPVLAAAVGFSRPIRSAFLTLPRARSAWELTLGTILGFLVVNLPFVLFGSSSIYFEVFRFHLRRSPNFETIWWVAQTYGHKWHLEWLTRLEERTFLDQLLLLAFLAAFLGALLLVWRQRWGPRQATFAAVLVFLILNKVFSVQYALWVLPFFTLLPLPAWSYALFALADAWVYATIFPFFTAFDTSRFDTASRWLSLAVVTRTTSLLVLLGLLVARSRAALGRPSATEPEFGRPPRTSDAVPPPADA
jgi:uncharacterized membrane protein